MVRKFSKINPKKGSKKSGKKSSVSTRVRLKVVEFYRDEAVVLLESLGYDLENISYSVSDEDLADLLNMNLSEKFKEEFKIR